MLRRMLAFFLTIKKSEITFIIKNDLNFVLECDGGLDYCLDVDGDSNSRFMKPCVLINS